MRRTATAVVGSLYGDEGKGASVDFLAAEHGRNAVVVRTNGGAQAGHTVVDGERRHVFHHIGSGTFAGASTHLARRFVSHPMFFAGEMADILLLGLVPDITADPRGYVTTPWDVMVNQIVEARRSGGRHGSCGMGFGETVGRNETTEFGLNVADLSSDVLADQLVRIRDGWTRKRLSELGIPDLAPDEEALLSDEGIVEHFLRDCSAFVDAVETLPDAAIRGIPVFEGAQGLLLDQDYGAFPHVTRSYTGIRNMIETAHEAGIASIEVFYAFRPYATRHGAGPLDHETAVPKGIAFEDPTNVPNPWQGGIRLAPLDMGTLESAIRHDLGHAGRGGPEVAVSLSVSCLDQVVDEFGWISDGTQTAGSPEDLILAATSSMQAVRVMEAWGPARKDRRIEATSSSKKLQTFGRAA